MSKKIGFTALHYGIRIGDNFFPPSQFAYGYLGATSSDKIASDCVLAEEGIREGRICDTPILEEIVRRDGSILDRLREAADRKWKSTKLIDRKALKEMNLQGTQMSQSAKNQTTALVESREPGQVRRPYPVSLYDALIDEEHEATSLLMEGGSRIGEVTLRRGTHHAKRFAHGRHFLDMVAKMRHPQQSEYDRPLRLVEYVRAAALMGLERIRPADQMVVLPFDFSKTPHYAMEVLLQQHGHPHIRRPAGITGTVNMQAADRYLLGKRGFVTPLARSLLTKGLATREVMLQRAALPEYHWAVTQALELHYLRNRRQFNGYSLEFPGTPYETVSAVFELPPKFLRRAGEEEKDISMRILISDHLGAPYVLYKNFNPEAWERIWKLGERDPATMTNMSRDRARSPYVKRWQETDWRTGRQALCMIFEPTDAVLQEASQLARQSYQGISKSALRSRYINLWRSRR